MPPGTSQPQAWDTTVQLLDAPLGEQSENHDKLFKDLLYAAGAKVVILAMGIDALVLGSRQTPWVSPDVRTFKYHASHPAPTPGRASGELDCHTGLLEFQVNVGQPKSYSNSNLKYLVATQGWVHPALLMNRDREALPTLIPLSRYLNRMEFEEVMDQAQNKSKYLIPLDLWAVGLCNEFTEWAASKEEGKGACEGMEELRLEKKRKVHERRPR